MIKIAACGMLLYFTSALFSQTCIGEISALDSIWWEPSYTSGLAQNIVLVELPPRETIPFNDSEIKSITLLVQVITEGDTLKPPILVPITNWPREPIPVRVEIIFNEGAEYCYRARLIIDVCEQDPCVPGDSTISYCSPFTEVVCSKQDATPPSVRQHGELPDCINRNSFFIPFEAQDPISGAVDSVTLYYRNTPGTEWIRFATKKIDETQPVVVDSILFDAQNDGYYEFYVGAKDTAWAPDQRLGRDGNEDIPNATSPPLYTLHVDTQAPTSSVQVIDEEQTSLCFKIPFTAEDLEKDGYKSGLNSVILYCQYEDEPATPRDTLTFSCAKNSVSGEFDFQAERDGRYRFFTRASDCCGNQQNDSPPIGTVVQATPQIEFVSPPRDTFMLADDVASIIIEFDRLVRPVNNWGSAVSLINRYANDAPVPFATNPSGADSTVRLIIIPERVDSTAFYEIRIDSVRSFDPTCQAVPASPHTFSFYTFMEAGKGGAILKPDLTLRVDEPGQPKQNVVFIFEPAPRECESRDGYRPLSDSGVAITARAQRLDGNTVSDIPGALCLHYDSASNLSPGSLRIYREIEGHCMPAGNSRNWSLMGQSVCADSISDVTGFFSLYGQDRDSLNRSEIALRNYPNPFGEGESLTTITYTLNSTTANALASNGGRVALRIFDVFGNLVKTFTNPPANEGENACPWDGRNDRGQKVANGGYIAVLELGGRKEMRKIAVRW